MNGTIVVVLTLFGLLAVTALVCWHVWVELGDVAISFEGQMALLAGVSVSLLLGIGLMFLVYYSHRHGYDDRAAHD